MGKSNRRHWGGVIVAEHLAASGACLLLAQPGEHGPRGSVADGVALGERCERHTTKGRGREDNQPADLRHAVALGQEVDAQGKHAEAQLLHEKALRLKKKLPGEEHPSTANSYNNLAVNLGDSIDSLCGRVATLSPRSTSHTSTGVPGPFTARRPPPSSIANGQTV